MMLIHWGAFTLAYHGWTEPIERALIASEKSGVNMITPKIGETISLDWSSPLLLLLGGNDRDQHILAVYTNV